MSCFLHKFCVLLLVLTLGAKFSYSQDEFALIESRINDYLKAEVEPEKLNQDVKKYISDITGEGYWPAINYSSVAETSWEPLLHLKRVKQFSLTLALKGQGIEKNSKLESLTVKALRYWLAKNPKSNNWFQNDIASPTTIGEILLLLKNTRILPTSLQDSLLKSMEQGNVVKAIGANKLDIATHIIYRASLTKDKALMDSAVHQAFLPITLDNREGLQKDYSYLQHGPQLQIASYGQVFLNGEYKVASWLLGTSYALSSEKVKILDHYLNETFLKTIRGRYIDFNTEGRGVSRNDVLDKIDITAKGGPNALLALVEKVNPENALALGAAQKRIMQKEAPSFMIKPAHIHFWKADYTVHNRSAYSFNLRSVSKRTVRAEAGNKENLLAKFLPDGSTNIQRSGQEYFNIMPVWEWDKIPGVTGRDYPIDQKLTIEWGERGVGVFVGGVSDGVYGASAYQLNYNEVTAKKAWFFFDGEVVCLGAAINSFAKEAITTTVNQAWQKGRVKALANNKFISVDNTLSSMDLKWIWHDSVGYYFPKGGKLKLSNQVQKGSWSLINLNRSKEQVKGKVFKLWFEHGLDPADDSYAYIVRPGVSEKDMLKPYADVEILSNDGAIQAVKNNALNMLQAVFHEPGILNGPNFSLKVDRACIVLIKNTSTTTPTVYVADPTQTLTQVKLSFNSQWVKENEERSISFPNGSDKGKSVSFQFE
ncbi:polysaccharide lyase family 8 super-sandwich domain-containing protein [Pedobacter jamesrossensis]|uniref:Polysaccharide lyase family 8 super-sandwich domain-containing protein n=1 Tax=Pedobacter jamesrossensis TaxID=1908238 RepID=A0ABV8NHU0_9SPHI